MAATTALRKHLAWLVMAGIAAGAFLGCEIGSGIVPDPSSNSSSSNNDPPAETRVTVAPSLEAPIATAPVGGTDETTSALQALLDAPPSVCREIDAALQHFTALVEATPNDAAAQTGLLYLQLIAASFNLEATLGEAWLPDAPDPFDIRANLTMPPAMAGTAAMEFAPSLPPPLAEWRLLWPDLPDRGAGLDDAQTAIAAEAMPLLGGRDGAIGALERLAALSEAEGVVLHVRVPLGSERPEVSLSGEEFRLMRAGLQATRAVLLAGSARSLDNIGFVRDRPWVDLDADQGGGLERTEYLPGYPFAGLHLSGENGPNGTLALAEAQAAIVDVARCVSETDGREEGSLIQACGDLTLLTSAWAARGELVTGEVEATLTLTPTGASDSQISEQHITIDASALFLSPATNPVSVAPELVLEMVDGRPAEISVAGLQDTSLLGLIPQGLPEASFGQGVGALRLTYPYADTEIVLMDAPVRWSDELAAAHSSLTGTVMLDLVAPALVFAPTRPTGDDYASLSAIDVVFSDALGVNESQVTRSRYALSFHGSADSVRDGSLLFYGPRGLLLYEASDVVIRLGIDTAWPTEEIRVPVDLGAGGLDVVLR